MLALCYYGKGERLCDHSMWQKRPNTLPDMATQNSKFDLRINKAVMG
jgi:hypothetical protein